MHCSSLPPSPLPNPKLLLASRKPIKVRFTRWRLALVVALSVLLATCSAFAQSADQNIATPLPTKNFVFGDERPFPQCHASTLLRRPDGSFLVAWFGGTQEKDDDVGIWTATGRPTPNGSSGWSDPQEVAKIRPEPHWNPVLFQAPNGTIYLYFKVGQEIERWETWVKTSTDQGQTWSKATELVSGDRGGRGPVRNKPIVLSDGTWLAGASHEEGTWTAFTDRSPDQGRSWNRSPYLEVSEKGEEVPGLIQPTLWESAPGRVHMLLRSTAGAIYRSDSEDYGQTWTPAYRTELPNPNSGIDLTRLPDGTLALAYNRDDQNWGARATLSIALSTDNGATWPRVLDVERGESGDEFSYPAIVSFGDTLALSYTWKRKRIAFWMGTADDIPESATALQPR